MNLGGNLGAALTTGVKKGVFAWEEAMVMAADHMRDNLMTREDVERFIQATGEESPIPG